MIKKNKYDVIIIGGGPAGSTAALYLLDAGFSVCVIERKKFPHEKLCGEFLSGEVMDHLKDLKLFDKFLSLNPNKIEHLKIFNSSGKSISSNFDFEAYALKRSDFDYFLLNSAAKRGAEIVQPGEVINSERNGYENKLLVKTSKSNELIRAKFIIGAFGKQSRLDVEFKRDFIKNKSGLSGIKYHLPVERFNDFKSNEIYLFTGENIYCGINKVNDNDVTLCFLEDRKKFSGSPYQHIKNLMNENNAFANLFNSDISKDLKTISTYGAGNIYFGYKSAFENGIFMIGDAAGVIAPLAGDGIGMAMDSAKIICNIFSEIKENNIQIEEAGRIYEEKWKKYFFGRIKTAQVLQNIFLRNIRSRIAFIIANIFPSMISKFVKLTRS